MRNRIYFFTGTGNSLRIAEKIAGQVQDCEIVAVKYNMEVEIPEGCDRIGFVFPVYFQGLPRILAEFLGRAKFPEQGDTYYFAIATYGGMSGNAVAQIQKLLHSKNVNLNYGKNLKMFSNYVVLYNMSQKVEKITERSEIKGSSIALEIQQKKTSRIPAFHRIVDRYYRKQIGHVSDADFNFKVSKECISCGKCAAVCASRNITMREGRPEFRHHCNQCMGCIQFCPERAINYKTATQNRRRYVHPKVDFQELTQYYR